MTPAAFALAAAALYALTRKGDSVKPTPNGPRNAMVRLISDRARAMGVPVHVALAFAKVESNFRPDAEGDFDWPTRNGGALYARHVRDNPTFANNPYRLEPARWHAYGLYQLLAPYHTRPTEDPRALLEPGTNVTRALTVIRRLLEHYDGDVAAARIHYVCGAGGCSPERRAQIVESLDQALARTLELVT